ncbi:MAG: hypothetical protein EXR69_11440 [Myxococcales bacterium]|nr:hypothetical protein [Myxococcales bacterium]
MSILVRVRLSALALPLAASTAACTGADGDDSAGDTQSGADPAALASLSDGDCPELGESGTSSFSSSGEDRQVTVILPSDPQPGMAVNFFFHGVTDPASTNNPGADTATGLDLQAAADQTNTVWVVPDAPVQNLMGVMEVYLWDLAQESDHDLVLYDDLRTCVGEGLDVDLSRLSAVGFSGGALWTTVVLSNRADTLATAVELSGGSDVEAMGYDAPIAVYSTPATDLPVLLTTGADDVDVWPDTSMVIVDFYAATDTLQAALAADGHFTVRCTDDGGHAMGRKDWNLAQDWLAAHTFGEESPYETSGLGDSADWCVTVAG